MIKIFKSRWFKNLCLFFSGIIFVLLLQFAVLFSDRIRPRVDVPEIVNDTLLSLIEIPEKVLNEFPVAALLMYDDSILSTGYNTTVPDHDFTKHAEINAINNAINLLGKERFKELDRDKLVLYTTNEPCLMCQGTIKFVGIENIVTLVKKPFKWNFYDKIKELKCFYNHRIGDVTEEDKQKYKEIMRAN